MQKSNLLFFISCFILSCILLLTFCAKNPAAPIHSADFSSGQCSSLGLVGTDSTTVQAIVPQPLSQLTLSGVLVKADSPFPTLPFQFLTLTATLSDTMGGYANFTIQSLTKTGTAITQNVPSGVLRWVPNLPADNYKVTVVPCNSLGCRKDLLQTNLYTQVANNYPNLQAVSSAFNQCLSLLSQLQEAGASLVQQSKTVQQYFSGSGLKLAATGAASCLSSPFGNGVTAMGNMQTLGNTYIGEIISNPDLLGLDTDQISQLETDTNTATSTDTATASNTTARTVLLSLGITGIVGGMMLFIASAVQSKGWTSLTGGIGSEVEGILQEFSNAGYTDLNAAKTELKKLNLPTVLEVAVDAKFDELISKGLKLPNLTVSVPPTSISTPNLSTQLNDFNTKSSTFNKSIAGGIAGALFTAGGIASVGASTSLGLASAATATSTNTEQTASNPFDATANYINNTILPLQSQLQQCVVSLNQAVANAPQK